MSKLNSILERVKARSEKLRRAKVENRPEGAFTAMELAAHLGVGKESIRQIINDMKENGDVEPIKLHTLKADGISIQSIAGYRLLEPKEKTLPPKKK